MKTEFAVDADDTVFFMVESSGTAVICDDHGFVVYEPLNQEN